MSVKIDPALAWRDPRLGRLLDWWRAQRAALGGLPGRQHFDPIVMPAMLPSIYMADVIDGGSRYRWRLLGTEITAMAGRDATGRFFDELYRSDIYDGFVASFDWVVKHAQPMRSFGDFGFTARSFVRFESMEVPLAGDGTNIDIVLGVAVSETIALPT